MKIQLQSKDHMIPGLNPCKIYQMDGIESITQDIMGVKIKVPDPYNRAQWVKLGFKDNGWGEIKMSLGQFLDLFVRICNG